MDKQKWPCQGDIWFTYLPWKARGKELKWMKEHDERRPVYIATGMLIRPENVSLVAPIGSNKSPNEPHIVSFHGSDNGYVYHGSLRCAQIQSLPLTLDETVVCDGGYILQSGSSPFDHKSDSYFFNTPETLDTIDDVLAGEKSSNLPFTPGDIVAVSFEKESTTPCVILNSHKHTNLVTVLQAIEGYFSEDDDNMHIFVIRPNEWSSPDTPLSIGLGLIRTIDWTRRCRQSIMFGKLSSERFCNLLDRMRRLIVA